jgi:Domain of unknown function (DUF4440)
VTTAESSGPRASTPAVLEETRSESEVVAALQVVNAEFVRGFGGSDAAWYRAHLRDDFVCTLADGRRINKSEFLRGAEEWPIADCIGCDEIDVRPLGDVALTHGVMHQRAGETIVLTRYTAVWHAESKHWRAVAAQFTPVAPTEGRSPLPDGRRSDDERCHVGWRFRLRRFAAPAQPPSREG